MDYEGKRGNGDLKPETVEYANETNGNGTNGNGTYQKKPTFMQKQKAHFKKYWWLHLISFVVCTLVISLCLAYVGFPNIAQSQLNGAELEVLWQNVTNPTSDSVQLALKSKVKVHSIFTPTLDSFDVALFLENTLPDLKPFGYVTIPKQHVSKSYTIEVNQVLKITDMDQFTKYNGVVLTSKKYRVAMRGETDLHLGALPTSHVQFNKVITMPGLDNLAGMQVNDLKIDLMPRPDGTNMAGTVFIPNPSPMTIFMGNVTMNLQVDGQLIGYSTMNEMLLKPGDNNFPMTSISDQAKVISMVTSKYKDGVIPLDILGNRSVVNGENVPYFTSMLVAAPPISIKLALGPALKDIGVDLSALTGGS